MVEQQLSMTEAEAAGGIPLSARQNQVGGRYMLSLTDYSTCQSCAALVRHGADCPPAIRPYPAVSVRPVRLLLVGWNPPRPGGGFWALDTPDRLRTTLHGIFQRLGLSTAPTPAAFLEDFQQRGFYLIHAIKCFSRPTLPRQPTPRHALVQGCVGAHLAEDLACLQPERVCLLGDVPRRALAQICPDLDTGAGVKEGQAQRVWLNSREVAVLTTCFPNRWHQAITERHLATWLDLAPLR
jgi:hypothetical protein